MPTLVELDLRYEGRDADMQGLDFYDASRALSGFQRTLALTTHLVLNDEIITQVPSLKGASIVIRPPQEGSWKTTALIVLAGLWYAGTASKDSPIGNLISSVYDYMIQETLGFHVDYSKTLGKQIEEYKISHPSARKVSEARVQSLAEKCTSAVIDMHRPIIFSNTANYAQVWTSGPGGRRQLGHDLNRNTYDYIAYDIEDREPRIFCGGVSSYTSNTYSGRVYLPEQGRIISFWLAEVARSTVNVDLITRSLASTARHNNVHTGTSVVCLKAVKISSKTGRIKKLIVSEVLSYPP